MVNGAMVNRQPVWYQGSNPHRLLWAVGPDVHVFDEDFLAPALASALLVGWTNTAVEAGTGTSTHIAQAKAGGYLQWDAAANENDGLQSQAEEGFKLEAGHPVHFRWIGNILEATQSDMLVGLCILDTSLLGGMSDGVYFRKVDGATALTFVTETGSTETETTVLDTIVKDTDYELEFYYDGIGKVYAYLDGVLVATHTTHLPTTELAPSVAYLNGAATMQHKGLEVDRITVIRL